MEGRHDRDIPGAPPGLLASRPGTSASRVIARRFNNTVFEEVAVTDPARLPPREGGACVWVDVTGLADTDTIAAVGRAYRIHELSLEDALDPKQRGKVDDYDDYTFIVLRTLSMSPHLQEHRLSVAFGDGFLITLQDVPNAAVAPVLDRLRSSRGKLRQRGVDYLAYALVDSVVDHYFPVIDAFDDHLESVEDAMLETDNAPIELARTARRDLRTIRHAVWPAREIVTALLREDAPWITEDTRVHLRDCYDHVVRLQEMVEASREIAASLLEAYLTKVSLRTNDVMKVLTVIATIFIPLTFIAGVYGMNFDPRSSPFNMPELSWYWGYPSVLVLMSLVVLGSLRYIRQKGWFGSAMDAHPSVERRTSRVNR